MSDVKLIPTASIRESSANPRQYFDHQAMAELEESIRARGILSPLLVRELTREVEDTDGYAYELSATREVLAKATAGTPPVKKGPAIGAPKARAKRR